MPAGHRLRDGPWYNGVMTLDPHALPVPDLGLRCRTCGYLLAGLPQHRCPECGIEFNLDDHIPPGDFPTVIFDGSPVLLTPEIMKLLHTYQIVYMQRKGPMEAIYTGNLSLAGRVELAVSRESYFEVIDLLRRRRLGLLLPPPPIDRADAPAWICRACGESCPGNFEVCWQCGADAPDPYESAT